MLEDYVENADKREFRKWHSWESTEGIRWTEQGEHINGERDGKCIEICDKEFIKISYYKAGKQHGPSITFRSDGVELQTNYKFGKPDGEAVSKKLNKEMVRMLFKKGEYIKHL